MSTPPPVTTRRIARLWWPLAMSWLMMSIELPLVTSVISRMPDEVPNLAALSSLVYPLALLVEGPIIMLLAASTALARDWPSYQRLWRFTHGASAALTAIHLVLAFTPAYDWMAREVIRVAEPVVEPGRIGLQLMTPWTWAIASRRFQQGVLIRFENSRAVVIGTVVRLLAVSGILVTGWSAGHWSGIAVGTAAIASGVIAEAIFIAIRTRPIVDVHLRPAGGAADPTPGDALTWGGFARFYVPLAFTPMLTIALQSIGAAAMNRMPEKLASTASWSSVYGLVFLFRSVGFAFNEVVVTLVDKPGGVETLRRISWGMAIATSGLLCVVAFTPTGGWFFGDVLGLARNLQEVAAHAVAFAVLMPGYAVMQSYYTGALVHERQTRAVTEAVVLYVVACTAILLVGIWLQSYRGIEFTLCSFTIAGLLQTLWLWRRSRSLLRRLAGQPVG